jgi:hypothetical protein
MVLIFLSRREDGSSRSDGRQTGCAENNLDTMGRIGMTTTNEGTSDKQHHTGE